MIRFFLKEAPIVQHAGFSIVATLSLVFGAVSSSQGQTSTLIGRWEGDVDGYLAQNGSMVALSTLGVTEGSGSLAITSPNDDFRWVLRKTFDGTSGSSFRAWEDAAADLANHRLEFDITYLAASIPQAVVNDIRVYVALDSPAGWSQVNGLAASSGQSDVTLHVSLPMNLFALAADADWYQFNLAARGNWGALPATFYIDALRIVDLNSTEPADFNADGFVDGADLAIWRSGEGDADGDDDTDGNDFLIWQRSLTASALHSAPEPSAALLALVAAWGLGQFRSRGNRAIPASECRVRPGFSRAKPR
jgi:hypothetical protein